MKYIVSIALLLCTLTGRAQSIAPPTADKLTKEKALAAKGDTAAMFHLGLYYYYGMGMPIDNIKAVQWLTKATQKNHPAALLHLGVMYEEGHGVAKDPIKALAMLRKAAELGNVSAMTEIGAMYEDGIGTKADPKEAVKWYRKAADNGRTEAMISLAMCYLEGIGVNQDKEEGIKLMQKASEKGDFAALRFMGDFYADSSMGNNCAKAMEYYSKASKEGDTSSVVAIGELLLDGDCPGADMVGTARWMKDIADKGNGIACYFMARLYIDGKGVEQDYGKAMDYFIKDADMQVNAGEKNCNSIRNLFVLYDMNKLTNTRKEKLLDWLEAVARKTGSDEIMAGLGYIYTNKEEATARDYATAMDWSMRSAEKGNATGCYNVGYLYANGLGVKKNDMTAFDWMLKAAKKGDHAAMLTLADFYEEGFGITANHQKSLDWKAKAKAAAKEQD